MTIKPNSYRGALPALIRQEIEEWVQTVSPRSAQREIRSMLKHVAGLAYDIGRQSVDQHDAANCGEDK